jgi:hypothetical protein
MVIGQAAFSPLTTAPAAAGASGALEAPLALAAGRRRLELAGALPLPGAGGARNGLQAALTTVCAMAAAAAPGGSASGAASALVPALQWRALLGDVATRSIPEPRIEFELAAANEAADAAQLGAAAETPLAADRQRSLGTARSSGALPSLALGDGGGGGADGATPGRAVSFAAPWEAEATMAAAGCPQGTHGKPQQAAAACRVSDAAQRADQAAAAVAAAAAVTPAGSLPQPAGSLGRQLQWAGDEGPLAPSGRGGGGGGGALSGLAGAMQTHIDQLAQAVESLKEERQLLRSSLTLLASGGALASRAAVGPLAEPPAPAGDDAPAARQQQAGASPSQASPTPPRHTASARPPPRAGGGPAAQAAPPAPAGPPSAFSVGATQASGAAAAPPVPPPLASEVTLELLAFRPPAAPAAGAGGGWGGAGGDSGDEGPPPGTMYFTAKVRQGVWVSAGAGACRVPLAVRTPSMAAQNRPPPFLFPPQFFSFDAATTQRVELANPGRAPRLEAALPRRDGPSGAWDEGAAPGRPPLQALVPLGQSLQGPHHVSGSGPEAAPAAASATWRVDGSALLAGGGPALRGADAGAAATALREDEAAALEAHLAGGRLVLEAWDGASQLQVRGCFQGRGLAGACCGQNPWHGFMPNLGRPPRSLQVGTAHIELGPLQLSGRGGEALLEAQLLPPGLPVGGADASDRGAGGSLVVRLRRRPVEPALVTGLGSSSPAGGSPGPGSPAGTWQAGASLSGTGRAAPRVVRAVPLDPGSPLASDLSGRAAGAADAGGASGRSPLATAQRRLPWTAPAGGGGAAEGWAGGARLVATVGASPGARARGQWGETAAGDDVAAEVMGFEERKLEREAQLQRLLAGQRGSGGGAGAWALPAWRPDAAVAGGASGEERWAAPAAATAGPPAAAALQRALLADVEAARRRHKDGFLRAQLWRGLVTTLLARPAPGETLLLAVPLANPLGRSAALEVRSSHPGELRPVESCGELEALRGAAGAGLAPVCLSGGFSSRGGAGGAITQGRWPPAGAQHSAPDRPFGPGGHVTLAAGGCAALPFALRLPPAQGDAEAAGQAFAPRVITVEFVEAADGGGGATLGVLEVLVVPRRRAADRALRLACAEGQLLRAAVPLDAAALLQKAASRRRSSWPGGQGGSSLDVPPARMFAACDDPAVAVSVADGGGAAGGGAGPAALHIRRKCGAAPGAATFSVWLYADEARTAPLEAWQVRAQRGLGGSLGDSWARATWGRLVGSAFQ